MALNAHEYMNRYRNLKVAIINEKGERSGWHTVDIHKYLLLQKTSGAGEPEKYNIHSASNGIGTLQGKIYDHFRKAGASLKVYIAGAEEEQRTFTSANDLWYYANKTFMGKGSPEEVSITLQLVLFFKMVTSPDMLQAWCDAPTARLAQGRVGLDCNGFVGNFLDHGHRGKGMDAVNFRNYTANIGVKDAMDKLGSQVKELNDLSMFNTYVLGMVDVSGQVINQFGAGGMQAHVMVSTPYTSFTEYKGNMHFTLTVVESTPDVGLVESTYTILTASNYVFEVLRGARLGTAFEKIKVRLRTLT